MNNTSSHYEEKKAKQPRKSELYLDATEPQDGLSVSRVVIFIATLESVPCETSICVYGPTEAVEGLDVFSRSH